MGSVSGILLLIIFWCLNLASKLYFNTVFYSWNITTCTVYYLHSWKWPQSTSTRETCEHQTKVVVLHKSHTQDSWPGQATDVTLLVLCGVWCVVCSVWCVVCVVCGVYREPHHARCYPLEVCTAAGSTPPAGCLWVWRGWTLRPWSSNSLLHPASTPRPYSSQIWCLSDNKEDILQSLT